MIKMRDYGGAFDIESDMFFTKEEIVEFADDVADDFSENIAGKAYSFTVEDVYIDQDILHIELTDGDVVLTGYVRIDMRRIRLPKDIYKYKGKFIDEFEAQYYDIYYTEGEDDLIYI